MLVLFSSAARRRSRCRPPPGGTSRPGSYQRTSSTFDQWPAPPRGRYKLGMGRRALNGVPRGTTRVRQRAFRRAPFTVASVFGTRPEAIKLAPVIRAVESDPDLQSRVLVTA